jgi:hypothetical protein
MTLSRQVGGSYNDGGVWVPASPVVSAIDAMIQPARGVQLIDLPEGIRAEAGFFLWTRSALTVGDRITHSGAIYRVLFVWLRADGGFTRAALGLLA